ncbi:hypothetical protein GCM10017786_01620 [Amycolatopsis deserti]|uniref:Aminotransferase class I/classII large domain-containing protein n=1 Tax=Amycolatopsis deserti TaxID=185696 RepID=A0ABQ3IDV6_9PSEU|nr:aminotransferase class I/II-fold pyridoxal phosphate-dependent enzyme [Amycolatopsis deserti]GHE76319.1 hypothetical protein GCM10017786_01620 [Amycolatopsis deserti]
MNPERNTTPAYRWLYEQLPPPTRSLVSEKRFSRTTVLTAYEQLRDEGYIVGRRGSGTYVARVLPERGMTTSTGRTPLPSMVARVPGLTSFLIGLPALDAFPFTTWARLRAARVRRSAAQLVPYGNPTGYRPLREAIASYISAARGIHCTADQVIITSGSQQALEFCAKILLDPGDPASFRYR